MSGARNAMPSVDLVNLQGLYTKQNPETLEVSQLRECKNVDFFREYGSLSKLRGTNPVLTGQYSETSVVKGIYWGSNYKSQELDGSIIRHVLIGAGTTIQKLNDGGSLTSLLTGEPNALYRTSDQLDRFLYITSQNPYSVGDRGQMSKYNGTRITQWGVYAPGEQATIREAFSATASFAISNCTIATSTLPAYNGTCIAMTKGASSTSAYMEKLNQTPFAVNTTIEDRVRMNFYIGRNDYRKLALNGRCVSIYLGSAADMSTNYYRFDFQIGRIIEGWNTLIMDFSTFPSGNFGTTVGTVDDENISSYRFEIITNAASDVPVVYWDNLVTLDQGASVPTFGGAGGTVFNQSSDGVWSYKITFIDENGFESNAGPSSIEADNSTGSTNYARIDLSEIPTSSNPAVVKRRLYRTAASGSEYLFLDTINDNTTTTYTDTTSDVSLGTATPPVVGDDVFDNSPPPSAGIMVMWKRTAFVAGDPLNPNTLTYSRYDLPDAFPLANTIEFDDRVTGLFKTRLGLVVTTETAFWRIIGDNPDYTVDVVNQGFGGVGPRGCGIAREMGWVTDRDGMRLYDLREAIKISEVIRDRVDGFHKGDLEFTHTAHTLQSNAILWFTEDADGVYSDIYMYQYMLDELRKGWFSQIVPLPSTFSIQHAWEIENSDGDHILYVSTDQGQVFEFNSPDSLDWLDETGKRRAITMEFWTPFMRLGAKQDASALEGVSGRCKPRFLELRSKENNGAAQIWTVTVETSDSASENATIRSSKELTFNFLAGQSLQRKSIDPIIAGEYVRLKFKNEELGKDIAFMGAKLYYHVSPGQFVVDETSAAGAGGQN